MLKHDKTESLFKKNKIFDKVFLMKCDKEKYLIRITICFGFI